MTADGIADAEQAEDSGQEGKGRPKQHREVKGAHRRVLEDGVNVRSLAGRETQGEANLRDEADLHVSL